MSKLALLVICSLDLRMFLRNRQQFHLEIILQKKALVLPKIMHLFDQKYSKTRTIVKYYQFKITVFFVNI